jgi:uncharacterized membrane protein YebE (DUF533 family)
MFDPQKLLQQFLGGEEKSGDHGDKKSASSTDKVKWAAIGGLSGLLLGSKDVRKLGGSALKMGGVAVVGGLAYKAWQNWQAQQSGQVSASTEKTTFLPDQKTERDELGIVLLSAMIAAAKSDGHIDTTEQELIFEKIGSGNLSSEEKGFLMDQFRAPLDIHALAAKATSQERATEIYAASVLAIDPDDPREVDYLNRLSNRLGLDRDLRASIDTEVKVALAQA